MVERSALKKFPDIWNQVLGALLESPNQTLRLRTLALLRARGLPDFDRVLTRLATTPTESKPIRLAAIGALAPRTNPLAVESFTYLTESLAGGEFTARSTAAQTLSRAKLSEAQLVKLAENSLSKADQIGRAHV